MEFPIDSGVKRKRSPADDVARPVPQGHVTVAAPLSSLTQINYLAKAKTEKLRLIEGDLETFGDVLGMIDDYEGVLHRHESLAANLGAKLVGPLLLKSFEKLFDGPIRVTQSSFAMEQSPVTWLDIVTFARSTPAQLGLGDSAYGIKTCRFNIKGGQIEISEDDYRLVMSGAPERMIPSQPIAEDESAELGTLNILEARLAILIKKADAVASKARQLNYHLKGRKTAVTARKAADQPLSSSTDEARTFSPQPFSSTHTRSPALLNGETAKLQQELLEQFLAVSHHPPLVAPQPRPKNSRLPTTETLAHHQIINNTQHDAESRRMSHPIISSEDGVDSGNRAAIASKIEKLARGDPINPPCDRCRRLKFDCTKHLTACTACTKKHAKCSWKDVEEGELETMAPVYADHGQVQANENNYPGPSRGLFENIDPGLRASDMRQDEARTMLQSVTPHRRSDLASEHLILTQIASAATGNR